MAFASAQLPLNGHTIRACAFADVFSALDFRQAERSAGQPSGQPSPISWQLLKTQPGKGAACPASPGTLRNSRMQPSKEQSATNRPVRSIRASTKILLQRPLKGTPSPPFETLPRYANALLDARYGSADPMCESTHAADSL
jgi:hypothetical protein